MDWFQIAQGVCQVLSPCLFNFCVEYIMQNARLDEAQAGIRIAGRNINNLRYADDTTLMAESHNFMASRWGSNGNCDSLYFLGFQNHCRW